MMVIYDYEIPEYDIWHMMIDEAYQGRGYGGLALDRVLDYIRTKPFGDSGRVALTCRRENARALHLYKSRGFQETGAADEGEIELSMSIWLKKRPGLCRGAFSAQNACNPAGNAIFLIPNAAGFRRKTRDFS